MKESSEPDAIPLAAPLACWHESLLSARSDRVVALGAESAFIASERPLPVGTRVFLELSLGHASNAAKGEIDAVVVEGGANGVSGFRVRFVGLDDAIRTWIARTLAPDVTPERAHVPPLVEFAPAASIAAFEPAPLVEKPLPEKPAPEARVPAPSAIERVADDTLSLVDEGRARHADEPAHLAREPTLPSPSVDARAARLAPHKDARSQDDPALLEHALDDDGARALAQEAPRPDDLSARRADEPALLAPAPLDSVIVVDVPEPPAPPVAAVDDTDDVPPPPLVDLSTRAPVVDDEPVELTLDDPVVDVPPARAEIAPVRDDGAPFNPFADIFTPAPVPPGDLPIELAPAPAVVDESVNDVVHALGLGANSSVDVLFPDASSLARAPARPVVEAPPPVVEEIPPPAAHDVVRASDDVAPEPPTVVVSLAAHATGDDDDEPLSISPAAPLLAESYSGVHVADAPPSGEIVPDPSPFEHAPARFEFSPPEPPHALVEASSPPTLPPSTGDDDDLDIAFSEAPAASDEGDGGILQLDTLATSLGELDPFDAFDAFNASRVQHTPAGGFPVIPPAAQRTTSTTTNVPPIVLAGEDVFSAQRGEDAPPPSPVNENGPFVTTLRFDGRTVQKELSEDAVARSVGAFPTVQTDPQFGVVMPPRTDPMFPAAQIADDALRVTGLPTPPSDDGTPPHLPSFAPSAALPVLTDDQRSALAQAGSFDDVVEVQSTSQLVKVSRGEDGVPLAIANGEPASTPEGVASTTDGVASTPDGLDVDFDDLSFATGPLPPEAVTEELPLVVGDAPPPRPANPFLADPNMLTRKR